jgi:hypothetical protein
MRSASHLQNGRRRCGLLLVRYLSRCTWADFNHPGEMHGVAPDGVADKLAQGHRDVSALYHFFHAHIYLVVDTLDDVMAIREAIKEVNELWICFGAQGLVGEVGRHCEVISSDNPIHIPASKVSDIFPQRVCPDIRRIGAAGEVDKLEMMTMRPHSSTGSVAWFKEPGGI